MAFKLGLSTAVAIGGLLLGSPALAVAPPDSGQLFAQLDADSDGRLSDHEIESEHRLLFERLLGVADDGDGSLTPEEFAAGLQPLRPEKNIVVKRGSEIPGSDALLVLLARMDVNGNRRIEREEVPQQLLSMFQRMQSSDANKNGSLELQEISRGAPRLARIAAQTAVRLAIDVPSELAKLPPLQRTAFDRSMRPADLLTDPEQAFAQLDRNGDGAISADEAPARFQNFLKRADRNGDSKLSKAEFMAATARNARPPSGPAGPRQVQQTVQRLLRRSDSNGDGAISRNEAPRQLAENFRRFDRNQDGRLAGEELNTLAATAGRLMRRAPQRPAE